ncbi:Class I SAM-dependent DNA methyltransferase [Deinococcus saxicola]|uniref:class I SAM-dependent DNA methyltransferase n=1 Tax=Deinococcus saxicola TaxID=249406 RepID=UPI0039EF2067
MAPTPEEFIARWSPSGGSERANYALFLSELCDVLGVKRPEVSTTAGSGGYVFEREVREVFTDGTSTPRFLDLYRKGCFVLEAKQGVEAEEQQGELARATSGKKARKKRGHGVRGTRSYDSAMVKAKAQAEAYARFLPATEGRPPFVLVVDVGHTIEVYSEFTRTGGNYLPFPDARSHRIPLADLAQEETRALLRTIWNKPLSLDPAQYAALATREVAGKLAEVGESLGRESSETGGPTFDAGQISAFLMRMIFTMFAEDMDLIPKGKFTEGLRSLRDAQGGPDLAGFVPLIGELWSHMAKGGYSTFLRANILHFNGGLFESVEVLPVNGGQLQLLIEAAECNWSQVEPSIFGTLVERALNPAERHRLGAHYTPRAYVERLVGQVVIEPLRQDWGGVLVAVEKDLSEITPESSAEDQSKARQKAVAQVEAFLADLRELRVLDPACGTGNFLYVSMELIKSLEAEVLDYLTGLGGQTPLLEVSPENFLGLELNPRAASVASLVLWIGYLQIYARGKHVRPAPPEPVLKAFKNIRQTDAVLKYRKTETNPQASRWDGESRIKDPTSGRMVPDPEARVQDVTYPSPSAPSWPIADFIVGNPPFIGAGPMRETLGDGYVKALRTVYKIGKHHPGVPDSADFVMYWWFKAAQLMDASTLRRFGFVTTNSIKQTFNRRVIEAALDSRTRPLSLLYAVPDHPWVDEADGAAVRIAMTVVGRGVREGVIERVTKETAGENGEYVVETKEETGLIHPDLTVGADVGAAVELKANAGISNRGVQLFGAGFIVPPISIPDPRTKLKETDAADLGLGRIPGLEKYIRQYRNGRDLNQTSRGVMVIDLFGLSEKEVREKYPEVYQHVKATVKPERDAKGQSKDGAGYAKLWWLFGKPRPEMRKTLDGLPRYIATVETSKHRTFQFLDAAILPDNMIVAVAQDDAYVLGVLSSRIHVVWALAQGGTLEDRPRYNKTRCFETFPFPAATPAQQGAICEKAEALDAHRKQRLTLHTDLTLTGLYNVLEKLRAGETLSDAERDVNTRGLVKTLKDLHDELDALVTDAYGWSADLGTLELLEKLAALNALRAAEERQDIVQYLRPEYQNPDRSVQGLLVEAVSAVAATARLPAFPTKTREQSQVVRQLLKDSARPLTPGQIAGSFTGVGEGRIEDILGLMEGVGQVREVPEVGGYVA